MKKFNYIEYITNNPLLKEEQRRGENLQQIVDYFIQNVNQGAELTEIQKAFILIKRNELLAGNYTGEEAKLLYMKLLNDLGSENKEVAAKALEQFDIFILPADRISVIWNDLSTTFDVTNLGTPPIKPADRDVQGYLDMLIQGAGDMLQDIKGYFKKVYEYFKDGNTYMKKQAELDKDSTFSNYAESAELIADLIGVSKEILKYFIPVIIAIAFFLYRVLGVGKGSGKKWYPSKARKDYEETDFDGFSQGQIFEQDEYKNEIKQYFKNIFLPFAKKLVEYFSGLSLKLKAKFLHSIVKATKSNDESKLNAVLPDEVMPEYNKVVNYLKGEEVNEEQVNEVDALTLSMIANFIVNIFKFRFNIKNNPTKAEQYISTPKLAYADAAEAKTDRQVKRVVKNLELALKKLESILKQTKAVVETDTQDIEDAVVVVGKELGREVSLESLDNQIDETLNSAVLLGKLHRRLKNELNTVNADAEVVNEIKNLAYLECMECGLKAYYVLDSKYVYCENMEQDCPNSYGVKLKKLHKHFYFLNESIHEGELEDKSKETLSLIDEFLKYIDEFIDKVKDKENNE